MGDLVIFGWNVIPCPLSLHEALAPFRFELIIAGSLRSAGRQRDRLERKLRSSISKQNAVGLLVRVRELRITEARDGQRADGAQKVQIAVREIVFVLGARVSPRFSR